MPALATKNVALPVLGSIEQQLRSIVRGDVRFDRHNRLLYSTDASIYQVEPLGVVLPADIEDVVAVLNFAATKRLAILPRGGGTSLAGQCTNDAIVLDLSAKCRQIVSIDPAGRRCVAEPGINLGELNDSLTQHGLIFAPDPATIGQATVGGVIGNNAAGARSIKYGRTSENLAAVDVVLSSGERCTLRANAGRTNETVRRLAIATAELVAANAGEIRARFPTLNRRNAGYGLDLILHQLDRGVKPVDLDLSGIICGSEGTLAVVTSAELMLHRIAKFSGLAVASFSSIDAAIAAVGGIIATGASAVELLDEIVLRAAATNANCASYLHHFPTIEQGPPRAVLYVEYQSATAAAEIEEHFSELKKVLPGTPIRCFTDRTSMGELWTLRKSAEALLHALSATRKPQTFVEDNAVPVERLSEFVAGFRKIVESHGTTAAYYAHASVGVLHVRPMIDLHLEADKLRMRSIAMEVADLARSCGGVMSGEHGDGRVRGPLLEQFYGVQLTAAFAKLKNIFDPVGILNPGMIVGAGAVESMTESLRVDQIKRPIKAETFFDYGEQHDFGGAVEMCNGAGFCRKTIGSTMCPSYRATLDERHSTRGRGNALRVALSGQLGDPSADIWSDPATIETLDLCLSCKACKSECPSSVDMSRLKAEYTGQRYRRDGAPLVTRMLGNVRLINRIGAIAPSAANFITRRKSVRTITRRLLNLTSTRPLPTFDSSLFRWQAHRRNDSSTENAVTLFGDCFTAYTDAHVGRAALKVLGLLGYAVRLPDVGCCGRAMLSMGLMDQAIKTIDRTIEKLNSQLDAGEPLLVGEPSCLSAIKDDWLGLKLATPRSVRQRIADQAMLVEDFIDRQWDAHPTRPRITEPVGAVMLHGHCHQKALWGDETSARVLRRVSDSARTIPSGCCGMAGSFGYEADKYDLSMEIGELSVFKPVRTATPETLIAAPGTSCRHQIRDGTGVVALHPIEIVARAMNIDDD